MAVKHIRWKPLEEVAVTPSQFLIQYNAMLVVKFSFVLLGSLCVIVYFSDVLPDLNLNPIKQNKKLGEFV